MNDRSRMTTMTDIAREAGVSQSTVSRVLNDRVTTVPIAPATRERVLAVAARLGFQPNPLARSLRGGPTMLLGVIVRDIADPFFAVAVETLTTQAEVRGYNVVLGTAHSRADEAIALRAVLETRHCDAIVVMGDVGDQPRLVEDLRSSPIPVVGLWQGRAYYGTPTVGVDNRLGIRLALAHLIGLGHTRIAFLGGRPLGDIRERRATFLETLAERGIAIHPGFVLESVNDLESGDRALRALMGPSEHPTAVIAATDQLAYGVLHAAHELHVRVPEDMSVVGFDDLPMSAFSVPALTTVAMPTADMTHRALDLAINAIGGTTEPQGVVMIEPKLVVRRSTGPPPREEAGT
jgi:DNA-binding LacI/PurR family transcriptional regulator